jgi:aspartyl-tRNA(Asn)/glutamyl-tRNA(Gln) amidotransferase subunit B
VRETPYSLRKAFQHGNEHGVVFFCTSQQEGAVDFSEYVTSHELWKEGAIPMGTLTTESVFTRLVSTLVATDDEEEVVRLMEERI